MKNIETKAGAIFEIWESRKEALKDLETIAFDTNNYEEMDEDDTLYIAYKDGTYFAAGWNGETEGKFRRTGIKTIVYSNACTTVLYGEYRIFNMDNIDEEYSEANDEEDKFWSADVA